MKIPFTNVSEILILKLFKSNSHFTKLRSPLMGASLYYAHSTKFFTENILLKNYDNYKNLTPHIENIEVD